MCVYHCADVKIKNIVTKVDPYSGEIYLDIHDFLEFSGTTMAYTFPHKMQASRTENPKLPPQPPMRATMFLIKDEFRWCLSS